MNRDTTEYPQRSDNMNESGRLTLHCSICGDAVADYHIDTEVLEQYDDGPGPVRDPSRLNTSPTRRMVPGRTVVTFEPCGHQRDASGWSATEYPQRRTT